MKDIFRQAVNLLAVLATIAVNALANTLPLNNQTTGEISDRFDVYFVPAGYVFSIWLVIYLGLLSFGIYQALPSQRENPRLRRVGYLFAFSSLANMTWLFLWHYEQFALTLVAMLALLLSLIVIYLRLEIGRFRVPTAESWLVRVPFSIYLGWISVATIANVTSLLDYLNWDGWGIAPEVWTVIMLGAVLAITAMVVLTRSDLVYPLVILWALPGIAIQNPEPALVTTSAWVVTGLVALVLLVGTFRSRRSALA